VKATIEAAKESQSQCINGARLMVVTNQKKKEVEERNEMK
jgi:hypothetical protein